MIYDSMFRRGSILMLALACAGAAHAKIVRFDVDKTETIDNAYERITGTAIGELDPADPLNAIITDIQFAAKSSTGKVEYATRFTLTKPIDMTKASGILWYDFVNRGLPVTPGKGMIRPEQQGHIALISGWQGDLAPTSGASANWVVKVPPAFNANGSAITGVALARIANARNTNTMPLAMLGNAIPYDAASLDTSKARVIVKSSETRAGVIGATRALSGADFAFADCSKTPFPGVPNPRMLCLKDGFDPRFLYEVTYDVKEPLVLGVGLAAVRDIASFFRFEAADAQGKANPVAGRITHAIVQGVSQSGNALKTFLLQGFNQDEAKRKVFDGANPHIAGRLTSINVRFGLPSGSGTLYEPGGEGVLWWTRRADPARSRPESSLLDRCTESNTCPKIFETFGAAEFNARLFTVASVGTDNKADLPLPANVRRYYFPGTTHGGDNEGGFDPAPANAAGCVLAKNPNPETEQMNALRLALAQWVKTGAEPPPSSYPRLADGQLVANTVEAMGWPAIPNAPTPVGMAIGLFDYDFGDQLSYNDFRGVITKQPPAIRKIVPPLMPKLDADGNETAGIPSVLHQAPLGTYTGWNVTADGFFKGQPCGGGLTGGYIPFAKTKAERTAKNDPRRSLEERYGSQRGYSCVVSKAAARAVATGFLLPVDAQRLIAQASAANILPAAADGELKKVEDAACK
jgi:hypothetical protein